MNLSTAAAVDSLIRYFISNRHRSVLSAVTGAAFNGATVVGCVVRKGTTLPCRPCLTTLASGVSFSVTPAIFTPLPGKIFKNLFLFFKQVQADQSTLLLNEQNSPKVGPILSFYLF
jgi:hypothetical protein